MIWINTFRVVCESPCTSLFSTRRIHSLNLLSRKTCSFWSFPNTQQRSCMVASCNDFYISVTDFKWSFSESSSSSLALCRTLLTTLSIFISLFIISEGFSKFYGIILEYYLMLFITNYAQNYAGICLQQISLAILLSTPGMCIAQTLLFCCSLISHTRAIVCGSWVVPFSQLSTLIWLSQWKTISCEYSRWVQP